MDAPHLTLPALGIGLFYAVGGLLLLRRLPAEAVMDTMLAALGDATVPAERMRTRLWILGGGLTFASGLSLVALPRWTPVFFVLTAAAWPRSATPSPGSTTSTGRRRN